MDEPNPISAERFMRGVYSGDTAIVEELAAEEVIITYPIFKELFDTPVIRGREAVKEFAARFSSRWAEPKLVVHERISQGDWVAVVWGFSARNIGSITPDQPPTHERRCWGGISVFEFNNLGKIVAEMGEESAPGPMARLTSARGG